MYRLQSRVCFFAYVSPYRYYMVATKQVVITNLIHSTGLHNARTAVIILCGYEKRNRRICYLIIMFSRLIIILFSIFSLTSILLNIPTHRKRVIFNFSWTQSHAIASCGSPSFDSSLRFCKWTDRGCTKPVAAAVATGLRALLFLL